MVNPVWAGVIGAIGGTAIGSLTSLLTPLIGWRVERKRLGFERENALIEHRRSLIAEWREGVREAQIEFGVALRRAAEPDADGEILFDSVIGRSWFESLRPHLVPDEVSDLEHIDSWFEVDEVRRVSTAITRVETDWGLTEGKPVSASG